MSLYREAIAALKQVILLDERLRNAARDLTRISQEIVDLRDRVSRLEGMLAVRVEPPAELRTPKPRRLPPPGIDQEGG